MDPTMSVNDSKMSRGWTLYGPLGPGWTPDRIGRVGAFLALKESPRAACSAPHGKPQAAFLCPAKETPGGLSVRCKKSPGRPFFALQEKPRAATLHPAKEAPGNPGLVKILCW